ncbi:hypothetical protein CLG85_008415, partial [Yangia mangrovi]
SRNQNPDHNPPPAPKRALYAFRRRDVEGLSLSSRAKSPNSKSFHLYARVARFEIYDGQDLFSNYYSVDVTVNVSFLA